LTLTRHMVTSLRGARCCTGAGLELRSRCDSWADQCGVRSGMGREQQEREVVRVNFNTVVLKPRWCPAQNEGRLMELERLEGHEREMLGGRKPSHTPGGPHVQFELLRLGTEHVGDEVARLTGVGMAQVRPALGLLTAGDINGMEN
jgi:hypothetical protein